MTKPFLSKKRKIHIPITLVTEKKYPAWIKKQSKALQNQAKQEGFDPGGTQTLFVRGDNGQVEHIYAGVHDQVEIYDVSECAAAIQKTFSENILKDTSFELNTPGLKRDAVTRAYTGWGWACYAFDTYKEKKNTFPALLWGQDADKKRTQAFVESVFNLRDLINTPANDLGPAELEKAARKIAKDHVATVKVIKDKDLLKQNYPMVFAVGDSSPRRPSLIDLKWGNTKHPKITLVGKGVCFDTGGLDIKPSQHMKLMKKDMGGAAHVLGLAQIIMALKLPVRLRVLIPAVENSISGKAFRPGDVFTSRKGITIENTHTDAEGRLILTDCLTAASEEKPDLIVSFATLTGSARAALGPDIPAFFSNNDKLANSLQKISMKAEDPLWAMPLWQPYRKHIKSSVAELVNSAQIPGDLIYSALFLESFLKGKPDWVHLDIYAWESSGRAGRPKGAADTGMRAIFALLEDRYSKSRKRSR